MSIFQSSTIPIGSSGFQFARTPGVGPPPTNSTMTSNNVLPTTNTTTTVPTIMPHATSASSVSAPSVANIYAAVYSAIPVYEIMCRGIAVMRRRADSWMNATQILKVAGVEKSKRTKILEKEILNGIHEKVQGGYGKYQGTWIPLERGRELAQHYGVESILQPLFDFKTDPDVNTPTKEQALAAQRRQLFANSNSNSTSSTTMTRRPSPPKRSASAVPSIGSQRTSPTPSPLHPSLIASSPAPSDLEFPPRKRVRNGSPGAATTTSGAETIDVDANSQHHRAVLMAIFLNDSIDELSAAPDAYSNLVIDDQGHTALHWAAALARIHILRKLIEKGANVTKQNFAGETALVRSVLVTNAYDNQLFYPLLQLLYSSLSICDQSGRTVLHHIALTAAIKGRAAAARYYMENILEWMAKHGPPFKSLIDIQDKNGDTALNIAARVGNQSLFQQLVDVGANRGLANKIGLRPDDFGLTTRTNGVNNVCLPSDNSISAGRKVPIVVGSEARNRQQQLQNRKEEIANAPVTQGKNVLVDINKIFTELDHEFSMELSKKQTELDTTHEEMRLATKELAELRRQVQQLRENVCLVAKAEERLSNMSRGLILEQQQNQKHIRNSQYQNNIRNVSDVSEEILEDHPHISDGYSYAIRKLSSHLASLRRLSSERERSSAKIIAMCCGLQGDNQDRIREQVDHLVAPLLAAVEADGNEVDLARVKMFMNKVRNRDGILGPIRNGNLNAD